MTSCQWLPINFWLEEPAGPAPYHLRIMKMMMKKISPDGEDTRPNYCRSGESNIMNRCFKNLVPFQYLKTFKRHKNLQVGDVCLIKYKDKVKASYRLCRILDVFPTTRAWSLGQDCPCGHPLSWQESTSYALPLQWPFVMDSGVQRLVLICPSESAAVWFSSDNNFKPSTVK